MIPRRHRVVISEALDETSVAWLAERCGVCRAPFTDAALLSRELAEADGLIIRTYTRVDEALLAAAPRLRVVGRAGVGLDNIDIAACRARGVEVVHTPDANGQAVAEFVFALLLDALRPRLYLSDPLDAAAWEARRRGHTAPRQLADVTLGVWGLGRIGTRVARLGVALGASVIFHDLIDMPEERRRGAQPVSREELLRRSDVLTLHTDPRESNRGLLDERALSLCKPDVVIVNTSRGMMVDAAALAAFLRANPSALALLDVHDPEPPDPGYPLWHLSNAHLTPHLAAATRTAHANMSLVVHDVWRVLCGTAPRNPAE